MQVRIKPEQLQSVIQQMLHDIPQKCDNAIDRAEQTVSKKAVNQLKVTSPVNEKSTRSGTYAKGWTVKKTKGEAVIHNRINPGLTHLLEHGHDILRNGQKVGHAEAQEHIKDAADMVEEEMVKEVEKELDNL